MNLILVNIIIDIKNIIFTTFWHNIDILQNLKYIL